MNKEIISIGLKVLVAVATGIAVIIGCENVMKVSQPNSGQKSEGDGGDLTPEKKEPSTGEVVLNSLRASQDTCGKVGIIVQSLGGLTQGLLSLFGKVNSPYDCSYSGYNSGNLSRVNNYVVQAGPRQQCPYQQTNIYNGNGNNYPF